MKRSEVYIPVTVDTKLQLFTEPPIILTYKTINEVEQI